MTQDASYPQPMWRVAIDGEDISQRIQSRLMQFSLTENRGMEADQLDITLDDSDGLLDIPPRKVRIDLALGWSHTGLLNKGSFTVDEVEHTGTPDQLTIRARSADLREGIASKKERSWHKTTLEKIVRQIADENGLAPSISPELASQAVAHLDQTSESDANLLTRLAETFDAVATIKSGRLLFFKIGRGLTVGGQRLERVFITRQDGDRHHFNAADRGACGAVTATYYDTQAGKKKEVTITRKVTGEKTDHSAAGTKTLRHTYSSKANATRAASAALDKAARGVSTFSLTLARGRPEIFPELPATVSGWKPAIDGADWLISKTTHRLEAGGLVTQIELELDIGGNQDRRED